MGWETAALPPAQIATMGSSIARQPGGQPTGGQFAETSRPSSGLSLADDVPARVRSVARHAGWPLLGDVLIELRDAGDLPPESLTVLGDDDAVALGEEFVGPTVDACQEALGRRWARENDLADDHADEYGVRPRLDTDALRERCRQVGVPGHVAGFVEAAGEREQVPPGFLACLTGAELRDLHDEHIAPRMAQLATHLSSARVTGG